MPLLVVQPRERRAERTYILETLLRGYLGIDFIPGGVSECSTRLELDDGSGRKVLVLPDVFLATREEEWLTQDSLPGRPLPAWEVAKDLPEANCLGTELPVIYGTPLQSTKWINQEERRLELGLDLLGSAFFTLTRYEETVSTSQDMHGRFPAAASLAYQGGFLDRPIVDEYVEVLWACMKRLWPRLERKERRYDLFLTHDVDSPFSFFGLTRRGLLRASAGDLIVRRSPVVSLRRLATALCPREVQPTLDPNNTFRWMMEQAERRGLRGAFYFSAGGDSDYDPRYSLEDPAVQKLIRSIALRGHEIGFHGSYGSMEAKVQTAEEVADLRRVLEELGVRQEILGGRQHYLRWKPVTWKHWRDATLDYDSSVGFRDAVGFRAGTAREYQVFDLVDGRVLPLRERPLVAMDVTLFSEEVGSDPSVGVLETVERLSDAVRKVGGTFTLLWHNSSLLTRRQRSLYKECIEICA